MPLPANLLRSRSGRSRFVFHLAELCSVPGGRRQPEKIPVDGHGVRVVPSDEPPVCYCCQHVTLIVPSGALDLGGGTRRNGGSA